MGGVKQAGERVAGVMHRAVALLLVMVVVRVALRQEDDAAV